MTNKQMVPESLIQELEAKSKRVRKELKEESSNSPGDDIKIIYNSKGPDSPFEKAVTAQKGIKAYSGDYYGAFSLEKFCSSSDLSYTHEDAQGWLNYLDNFYPRNFWYKDEHVRIWAYYEQYDNWLDTYGLDAVLAAYHSGHGAMEGDGRFRVPLGADWGGQGCRAWSNQMQLGNEQVRYLFWSTCQSLRVLGGHNPIRTWGDANLGFRMLFGYETNSDDHPDYGSAFWKHWNKGKSFSTAFLDASWYDISHYQAPSVVACGATKEEAINRVFNERYFDWSPVSRTWWWWRWYYAASAATAARMLSQELPGEFLIAELQPREVNGAYVQQVLQRHQVSLGLPREITAGPDGVFFIREGDASIAFEGDGSYELQLAKPNRNNKDQLSINQAIDVAKDFIYRFGMEREGVTFDRIMHAHEGGGSTEGSGQLEGPYVTETVVQFTQLINGLPVLLPGKGGVAVTIDNDGTVTNVKNSTRRIERLVNRANSYPVMPGEEKQPGERPDPKRLLADAWQERLKHWVVKGRMPLNFSVVPGTYEVGYSIKGNRAILVAKNVVEVDCGEGYFKRYTIEIPILE